MAISAGTKQILWVKAAGRCAFSDCRRNLILAAAGAERDAAAGEMAHIVGKSEERGPRCEFPVPGGERDGYSNLILLCPTCHTKIDRQEHTYTVERLLQIKIDHERWVIERLELEERYAESISPRPHSAEQVHSTLLWVEQMPRYVYTAPCEFREDEVRPRIRRPRPEDMVPYIVREKKLICFTPLETRPTIFDEVLCDPGAAERHLSADWWKDPDLSSWYVTLLNRLLNKICGRKGLNLDKVHRRYYFEPVAADEEGGSALPREVRYRPLNAVTSTKQVAWRPHFKKTGDPKSYWEHLAVGLRFHRVAPDQWVLSVRPERRFTRDGYVPLTPKGTGRRSTSKKSHLYNYDLLGELQFWRDFLTDGGQRLIASLGGQSLIVDGTLMAATAFWPGVPDDAKPFRNAEMDEDLFSAAAHDAALEDHPDAELHDWEAELVEEIDDEDEVSVREEA